MPIRSSWVARQRGLQLVGAGDKAAAALSALDAHRLAVAQSVDPQASLHVAEALVLAAQARAALGDATAAARDATTAQAHLQATVDAEHPLRVAARRLAEGSGS